jgi:ribosome-associated toxin RatA of RatAB toxin-antitoxin module
MHEIDRSVLLNYSAEQIFVLVDRVEDYPAFLPWCGETSVEVQDENRKRAAITIDFKGIRQRFATDNTREVPTRIDMRLAEGPFRNLDGTWHFLPLGEHACKVQFRLRYEFASRILEKVVGPVFDHIAASFVDAFVRRAAEVYGPR